jgi:tRNA A37 threonylcarbamoyladenosine synthetase subunit TsaC/SUA5/YrdC
MTAEEASAQLGEDVSVYLDAGPCDRAVPSTIVDLTTDVPRILRLGALDGDELRAVVPEVVDP